MGLFSWLTGGNKEEKESKMEELPDLDDLSPDEEELLRQAEEDALRDLHAIEAQQLIRDHRRGMFNSWDEAKQQSLVPNLYLDDYANQFYPGQMHPEHLDFQREMEEQARREEEALWLLQQQEDDEFY